MLSQAKEAAKQRKEDEKKAKELAEKRKVRTFFCSTFCRVCLHRAVADIKWGGPARREEGEGGGGEAKGRGEESRESPQESTGGAAAEWMQMLASDAAVQTVWLSFDNNLRKRLALFGVRTRQPRNDMMRSKRVVRR